MSKSDPNAVLSPFIYTSFNPCPRASGRRKTPETRMFSISLLGAPLTVERPPRAVADGSRDPQVRGADRVDRVGLYVIKRILLERLTAVEIVVLRVKARARVPLDEPAAEDL